MGGVWGVGGRAGGNKEGFGGEGEVVEQIGGGGGRGGLIEGSQTKARERGGGEVGEGGGGERVDGYARSKVGRGFAGSVRGKLRWGVVGRAGREGGRGAVDCGGGGW